ncbi:WPP domain-interacting protein 2-like [Curcuma longa]|uniref:WPP domain-interacting protein 2-like n=1 Tax=Curcuma longa TaxID=136217 RepID=UPI003D9F6359
MKSGEDLGSGLPGVQENENAEKVVPLGEIEVKFNGVLDLEEASHVGSSGGGDRGHEGRSVFPAETEADVMDNGDAVGNELSAESTLNLRGSPCGDAEPVSGSKSAPPKGYGLRKWRRIRRDSSKDAASIADSAQIHKRRLSFAEPSKVNDSKHKNDDEDEGGGSVASLVSMNISSTPLPVIPTTLGPDLGVLITPAGFNIGIDSENSDDQSSKSSTVASALRFRHEAIGLWGDRSRTKVVGGKGTRHAVLQQGQRAKEGRSYGNRMLRENQVKIEMENSYSSIESDLGSSNATFVHMGSVASDSKQSEKSINNSGDQNVAAWPSEEVRSNQLRDLSRGYLDGDLSGEVNNTKSESSQQGPDLDPFFLESIDSLQTTKEALEKEIQIFEQLRKGNVFDDYDSEYENIEGAGPMSVQSDSVELYQMIEHLNRKLGVAIADAEAKESKLSELEAALKSIGVPNKNTTNSKLSFLQEKCKEMEMDFEELLEKKIEAEIQCLIMKRTTESWRVITEDHIALREENIQSEEQSKVMLKLKNFENKSIMLSKQAEELEEGLAMTEEVLRLQRQILKYSFCLFAQMITFCIALVLFIMYLLPSSLSAGVTPT